MPRRLVQPRPRSDQWPQVALLTSTAVSRILGAYALLQGLTVTVLDDRRWDHSPALALALSAPGGTNTWGVALTIAGLLVLYGSLTRRMRTTALGHFLGASWSAFFAISQAPVAIRDVHAPTTGVFVYGAIGVLFATLAAGAWQLRR